MNNTLEFSSNFMTIGFLSAAALLIFWVGSRLLKRSIDLDGPPNPSWIAGSGVEGNDKLIELEKRFLKDYGRTVKIYEPLGTEGIHTSDPMAIHSLTTKDSARYGRAGAAAVLRVVLGGGLFTMHGPKHRLHRKVLNPVFVHKHLREQMAIFDAIAIEACDAMVRDKNTARGKTFEIDVYRYMNSSALELIGQAGLGYSFGSFEGRRDAYSTVIKHLLPAVVLAAPWLPFLVAFENFGSARFRQWIAKMTPSKVVQDLRKLVNVQHDQAHEVLSARKTLLGAGQSLNETTGSGHDVLTLLMRANEKLPKDGQMSKEEMIGHMNSFIFAGHETTSGAITRALDMLSIYSEVQDRLRAEVSDFMSKAGTGEIDRDKIDSLPYLDAVCREVLRLAPPVGMIRRICLEDTVLPLKYPVNTSKGPKTSIFVPKGASVSVGIDTINHDKDIWGPDADEFVPDRWLDGRASNADGSPGTYSHMMTFSAGPTACIGFKFAVLEIKILLVRLITRFKFEDSDKEFVWMLTGTQAPYPAEDAKRPATQRKAQLLMKLTEL